MLLAITKMFHLGSFSHQGSEVGIPFNHGSDEKIEMLMKGIIFVRRDLILVNKPKVK